MGVGTCWPWETAATLPSAWLRKALRRPRWEERGGGISWRPPAYSLFIYEVRSSTTQRSELKVSKFPTAASASTFGFCLAGQFSGDNSKLGLVRRCSSRKESLWLLAGADFFTGRRIMQAMSQSCQPTSSVNCQSTEESKISSRENVNIYE